MLTVFEHKTISLPAGLDLGRLRRPRPFVGADPAWTLTGEADRVTGSKAALTAYYYVGVDWLTDDRTESVSVLPKFQAETADEPVEIDVGVDRLTDDRTESVSVPPKLQAETADEPVEIDVLGMLTETLKDPGTLENVSDLLFVDWTARPIEVPVRQPLLPLFLITAFVATVKSLTRQGLKKSFTLVEDEMRQKMKGKILWKHSLSVATPARRLTCRYQDLTVDTPENRFLKWALVRSLAILNDKTNAVRDLAPLREALARGIKDFSGVTQSPQPWNAKLTVTPNPLYRRYNEAIELARKILHLDIVSPAISTSVTGTVPPFWINMPKLFELYVYKKLRDALGCDNVAYQTAVHGQYPDFILQGIDEEAIPSHEAYRSFVIADAKYKLHYFGGGDLLMNDARQLAGYGRLKPLFDRFASDPAPYGRLQPPACLIIHPAAKASDEIDWQTMKRSKAYVAMWLLGLRIPTVGSRHGV